MNTYQPARSLALLFVLVSLVLVAACGNEGSRNDAPQAQATADASPPAPSSQPAEGSVTIAGITVTPPAGWTSLGASGMRQAQFQLPATGSDTAPAEVNVFYFGPSSGGGVEPNLQRWMAQIENGTEPVRGTFTADGMDGHVVSLDGAYKAGNMRPMGGGDSGPAKPGHRLVGVVLEGPQGSLFFKLTGPEATARSMEDGLTAMVKSAHKAG